MQGLDVIEVAIGDPEAALDRLGLSLPRRWEPGATMRMCTSEGGLLFLSGHLGVDMATTVDFHSRPDHHPLVAGRLGGDVDLETARRAAEGGALNLIATLKDQLGDLGRVRQILKVTLMVSCVPGFDRLHQVADAASDLLVAVFGARGEHARSTVGAAAQPGGALLAMDAIVAVVG